MGEAQGVVYGEYYLLGRLAQGGMAEVFLAKGLLPGTSDDLMALKRTLPQFSDHADFVSMFTDEARIARGLKHPNICQIHDQGEFGNQLFIVMEFIHGKDLKIVAHRAKQRGEMIPPRYLAFVLMNIATALDFAHNKENEAGELEGIVHRDVSPQNILISYDGVPKLIDFGIAKARDRVAKTKVGVVKGKFAYMSPEQAIGGDIDRRTDVFALGVVLYELLTGHPPFKGSSDFSTLKKIAKADFTSPESLRKDLPPRLVAIVERALQRDVAARYQTAEEMGTALEEYLDSERSVTASSLSAYMRKLFRDDYIREMARIKSFYSIQAPAQATQSAKVAAQQRQADDNSGGPSAQRAETPFVEVEDEDAPEKTQVISSADLAAGYDAEEADEEITGLQELLGNEEVGDEVVLEFEEVDGPVFEENTSEEPIPEEVTAGDFEEPTAVMGQPRFEEDTRNTRRPESTQMISSDALVEDDDGGEDAIIIGDDDDDAPTIVLDEEEEHPTMVLPDSGLKPLPEESTEREPMVMEMEPTPLGTVTDHGRDQRGPAAIQGTHTGSDLPRPPRRLTRKRRTGALSSGEIVILLVVSVLCALVVAGSYYYAAFGMPPELQKMMGQEAPQGAAGQPRQPVVEIDPNKAK